eukprot:6194092-Pleurochrysis_carterae.AAC.3
MANPHVSGTSSTFGRNEFDVWAEQRPTLVEATAELGAWLNDGASVHMRTEGAVSRRRREGRSKREY